MLAGTQENIGETSTMILEADFEPVDLTTAVFRLTGRMTLGTRLREIESKISEVAGKGIHKLILDLSGIEFLDSAGLGVLMILYGNMKVHRGQLRLVAPRAKVLDVLKLTHTDSILAIDPNLEAALAS
jgi:anti-sigma B factor antagonist